MPKNKPKLEARVVALRDALASGMWVSEMESVWDTTFSHRAIKTSDGFIVTDRNGRKYEVKICPIAK